VPSTPVVERWISKAISVVALSVQVRSICESFGAATITFVGAANGCRDQRPFWSAESVPGGAPPGVAHAGANSGLGVVSVPRAWTELISEIRAT